jgi:hypothetical protein
MEEEGLGTATLEDNGKKILNPNSAMHPNMWNLMYQQRNSIYQKINDHLTANTFTIFLQYKPDYQENFSSPVLSTTGKQMLENMHNPLLVFSKNHNLNGATQLEPLLKSALVNYSRLKS